MRPLRLELSGFMPFLEKQIIEFADLSLFAICGPTGSGKSTILDAVVYALYGRTPRLGSRGLTDLINPSADTLQVTFDFEVRDSFYRIMRVLSSRRSGTELRLYHQDEDANWKQLPEVSAKEVNYKLVSVVGLDYSDFVRAVLLPQGDFDSFLKGQPKERRALLIKLLNLERIPYIMHLSGDRAKAAQSRLEFIIEELTHYSTVSEEILAELQKEEGTLKIREKGLQESLQKSVDTLAKLESLKQLTEQCQGLETKQKTLAKQAQTISQDKERLAKAQKATPLIKPMSDLAVLEQNTIKLTRSLQALEPKLVKQEQTLEETQNNLTQAKALHDERLPEIDKQLENLASLRSELKQLKSLGGDLTLATKAVAEVSYSTQTWQTYQTQLTQLESLKSALAQQAQLESNLTKHLATLKKTLESQLKATKKSTEAQRKQSQATHKKAQSAVQKAQKELAKTTALKEELVEKLEQLKTQGKVARETSAKAKQAYNDADTRNRALALRQHLHQGDVCPVCEQTIKELPSAQDVDLQALQNTKDKSLDDLNKTITDYQEANSQFKRAEEQLTERQENLASCETELKVSQEHIGTLESALTTELQDAEEKLVVELEAAETESAQQRQTAAQKVAEANAPFAEFELVTEDALTMALSQKKQQLLADLAQNIGEKAQGLDPEKAPKALRQEKKKLADDVEHTRKISEQAQLTLNESKQEHGILQAKLADFKQRFDNESELLAQFLQNSGFTDTKEVRLASLEEDEQEQLSEAITNFTKAEQQTTESLKEVNEALAGQDFTLEHYQEVLDSKVTAEKERETAIQRLGSIASDLKSTREKLLRKTELATEQQAQQEDFEVYQQLRLDLQGNNFQNYLVRRVQEQLSLRASSLLRETSKGRYDLYFQNDEYFVSDAWHSGELRSIKNLSGGETFMTSLALALALSDTIAGNIQLGALFLDEGFGTLDSDSLDVVAGVLENLSAKGRMVGVISHVDELTERIPDRLHVVKSNEGSRLEWDV